MRRLALWGAVTLLPACCVFTGKVGDAVRAEHLTMAEQLEQKTVALVHFVDGDNEEVPPDSDKPAELRAYCSGVWVSDDVFLSAEHCVDDIGRPKPPDTSDEDDSPKSLKQLLDMLNQGPGPDNWTPQNQPVLYSMREDITPDKRVYRTARVMAVDMYSDLILVKIDKPVAHPVAQLRVGPIHVGEDVHIEGHTYGMWWTYMRGYVSAWRPGYVDDEGHKRNMLQVSAPVFFGNSGGGAFDAEGRLIGIADTIRRSVPNCAFFVHRDVLEAFLEHNKVIPPQRVPNQ